MLGLLLADGVGRKLSVIKVLHLLIVDLMHIRLN
jgi:hypothetical protein